MHGSEVIKHLKDNTYTREIPVIILSADAMPTRQRSLMDMGAEYYLTKPIHLNDLLLEIDKYQH
jgi:CheY-like chemotaxis protein